jgi:hypothetical protein
MEENMIAKRSLLAVLLVIVAIGLALGGDEKQMESEQDMPPMGPPKQMQDIKWLAGEWNVVMKTGMDPDPSTWSEMNATCTYAYILDGAAMQYNFGGAEWAGMPFEGTGIECYDREKKQWQMSWIDNMSGRMSLYTGKRSGDSMIMIGPEMWNGQEMLGRITSYNETPTSFDWKMESSTDGGKTWVTTGTAVYTKKK